MTVGRNARLSSDGETLAVASQEADNPDALLRAELARGLARVPEAASLLVQFLEDPDAGVRAAAASSIVAGTHEGTEAALSAYLADGALAERLTLLLLLSRRGPGPFLPAVWAQRADPQPEVREWALSALAGSCSPPAWSALEEALVDPEPFVSQRAARALWVLLPDEPAQPVSSAGEAAAQP